MMRTIIFLAACSVRPAAAQSSDTAPLVDRHYEDLMNEIDEDGDPIGREHFIQTMDSNHIVEFDVDTLPLAVDKHSYLFVAFCTPWCTNCWRIGAEFSMTAKALKDDITFGLVDVTRNVHIWDGYGISEYPSFLFFNNGVSIFMHGGHDRVSFTTWLAKQRQPLFMDIHSQDEVLEYVQQHWYDKVGVFEGRFASSEFDLFQNLARHARDSDHLNKFVAISNDTRSVPRVEYVGDQDSRAFEGAFDEEELRAFMHREQFASWAELSTDSMRAYQANPVGNLVVACFPPSTIATHPPKWRQFFTELALKFRDEFVFTWIDTFEHGDIAAEYLGCQGLDPEDGRITLVAQTNLSQYGPTFTHEMQHQSDIEPWLREVLNGTAAKHIFSRDEIADENSHVTEVTANSWQEQVVSSGKDSIVMIYAPWCPHSKIFTPVYMQFGRIMADHNVSSQLNVLKLNGDMNTVEHPGLTWSHYPTVYYIKHGDAHPIYFDCTGATANDLVALVQDQASFVQLANLAEEGKDPIINISEMKQSFDRWSNASRQVTGSVHDFIDDFRRLAREQRKLLDENAWLRSQLEACQGPATQNEEL